MRSNFFVDVEDQVKNADNDEIKDKTWDAFCLFYNGVKNILNGDTIIRLLAIAARLGVSSEDGELNYDEKELIEATFGRCLKGNYDEIYDIVASPVTDSDYAIVDKVCDIGTNEAMAFLYFILGFAYIDGEADDDVLDKLDGKFGMTLLLNFKKGLK
jgi:hypothetical protein